MQRVHKYKLAVAAILMALAPTLVAQHNSAHQPQAQEKPARHAPTAKMPLDRETVQALQHVSAARIRASIEKLVSFGTRSSISPADAQAIATGRGIGAAREWIKSEFQRYSQACGGCLEVKTHNFVAQPNRRIPQPTEMVNVYAVLRGRDPQNAQRMVLVTGHYDSIPSVSNITDTHQDAPGANDDASGTAVSLECARVLSKHKFPATIVFLAVAGEEQGLIGSRHFAEMARKEGWQLEAVLNNDIVGGDRSPGQNPHLVRVFSEGIPSVAVGKEDEIRTIRTTGAENDSPSRQLARYIAEVSQQYLPGLFRPMLVFRPDRYLRGGDHTSFNELGFAAVRFTEYRENYNHQHQNVRTGNGIEYGDLPKFVDYDYIANVARLNAAVLASLASAPAPPANVRLETRRLENDSTLMWEPPAGARDLHYEVLWRDTSSPEWQHASPAGDATEITLPLSKDNVIFALRSVDEKGHRSLPVVPKPER